MLEKSYGTSSPTVLEPLGKGKYMFRKNITLEDVDEDGNERWSWDEMIVDETTAMIFSTLDSTIQKREQDIIDEFTLKLVEEGSL